MTYRQFMRRITMLAMAGMIIAFGSSLSSNPAKAETIACFHNTNGKTRLVASDSDCKTNETAISLKTGEDAGGGGRQVRLRYQDVH